MVTLPAVTPVTTPVPDPIVATATLLLVHVPPPTELVSVVGELIHNVVVIGLIAVGVTLIVTAFTAEQPEEFV